MSPWPAKCRCRRSDPLAGPRRAFGFGAASGEHAMKMVRFTKEMRPHCVGDRRVVPDAVAHKLVDEGSAEIVPSVYDQPTAVSEPGPRRPRRYATR